MITTRLHPLHGNLLAGGHVGQYHFPFLVRRGDHQRADKVLVAALARLYILERHDDRIVAPVVGIEAACGDELADVAHVVEGVGRQPRSWG